jgi:prevent-host-death family protein
MVTFMVMKSSSRSSRRPATISAAEFKAKCLELMDSVSETGASIVVTKRGRPVAVLAPVRPSRNSLRGIMKGRLRVVGDIVSPIDVVWDAER